MSPRGDDAPSGLRVATVAGIPIYIGTSWAILAVVIVALVGPGVAADRPDLGVLAYGVGLLYAIGLLLAVLVHEGAHAVVARAFGHEVHHVVADLWGGHTTYDPRRGTPGSAAAIAVVGPISNALLGLAALAVLPLVPQGVPSGLAGAFTLINLLLAAFNLLPGLPLDGGQLVEALVWRVTGSRPRGRVVAGWCGWVVAVLVVLLFALRPLLTGGAVDPFSVVWGLIIAGFLWQGASASIGAGQALGLLGSVSLDSVIRPVIAVRDSDPVSVLDRVDAGRSAPVVIDGRGHPVAMLSAGALDAVPPGARERTPVAAVMARQPPEWAVELTGEDDVVTLVRAIQTHRLGLLAATREGRCVGVVSAAELGDALQAAEGRGAR